MKMRRNSRNDAKTNFLRTKGGGGNTVVELKELILNLGKRRTGMVKHSTNKDDADRYKRRWRHGGTRR